MRRAIGTTGDNVCQDDSSATVDVPVELLTKWLQELTLAQQQTYPMYQRQMVRSVIDQIAATISPETRP